MSTTANSSSLFNNFKTRLGKARVGYVNETQMNPYGQLVDERTPVLQELDTQLAKSDIDLNAAKSNISRNQGTSSARSAFAAGAASRTKKLFKRKGSGSYSAIGRTDAATSKAVADREKEIVDLRSLDPSLDKRTGQRSQSTTQFGPIIKLW